MVPRWGALARGRSLLIHAALTAGTRCERASGKKGGREKGRGDRVRWGGGGQKEEREGKGREAGRNKGRGWGLEGKGETIAVEEASEERIHDAVHGNIHEQRNVQRTYALQRVGAHRKNGLPLLPSWEVVIRRRRRGTRLL